MNTTFDYKQIFLQEIDAKEDLLNKETLSALRGHTFLHGHIANPEDEYDQYYRNKVIPHKIAVFNAGMELWKHIDPKMHNQFYDNLILHDLSKFSPQERAYATHNFQGENTEGQEREFERAWHHHYQHNPHHPEYWHKVKQNGDTEAMVMPMIYIWEMIADWIGAGKTYGNTLENWIPNNLHLFAFHRESAERLLEAIKLVMPKMNFRIGSIGHYTASFACVQASVMPFKEEIRE